MNFANALKRTGYLSLIIIGLTLFSFIPTNIAAQTDQVQVDTTIVGDVDQLTSIDLGESFGSIGGLAAMVLLLTALVKKYLKTNNTLTIVISGAISLIVSAVGYAFGFGVFAALQPQWWYIIIYGASAMIIANGFSTWGAISKLLILLKLKAPAK